GTGSGPSPAIPESFDGLRGREVGRMSTSRAVGCVLQFPRVEGFSPARVMWTPSVESTERSSDAMSDAGRAVVDRRARELFQRQRQRVLRRNDRLFAALLGFEWVAAMLAALFISPRTWIGPAHQGHPPVLIALGLGGAITCVPILAALA